MKNNKRITVGLTFDVKESHKACQSDPADMYAEFDHKETIDILAQAIEDSGYEVVSIGGIQELLNRQDLLDKTDIVFNIAEGLYGRNRESQVPMYLEMKGKPYVGSDALTLGATLDKVIAKKLFISEGIPTPDFFVAEKKEDLERIDLEFPLIVKPRFEGSSKGLGKNSIVNDLQALKRQVEWITATYKQAALIEKLIIGSEFTVPFIGNPGYAYEPVQISIEGKLNLGRLIYDHGRIASPDIKYIYPADVSVSLAKKIKDAASAAYKALECLDFARIDLRVDEQENVFVLEINPLPSLSVEDVFMKVAEHEGVPFSEIVARILNAAISRYNGALTKTHKSL